MPLDLGLFETLTTASPREAWAAISAHAWDLCSAPLSAPDASAEVTRRDRELADVDLFLAGAGWELWSTFESDVERTAEALEHWWTGRDGGAAVLVLDALSLREVPWILQGAKARGYRVSSARPTGSELPGETGAFAKALGYPQRSALAGRGAGMRGTSTVLPGARTDCLGIPWEDCTPLIGSEPRWILWHEWPDASLHEKAAPGQGLAALSVECERRLSDDGFWTLVERLTQGRRLVITSDHGYAASGLFPDAVDDQARYLKDIFASGRFIRDGEARSSNRWAPPIDLALETRHGPHRFALGRQKWKSPGGYPTLAHGGLSVLEVLSPFVELSRGD